MLGRHAEAQAAYADAADAAKRVAPGSYAKACAAQKALSEEQARFRPGRLLRMRCSAARVHGAVTCSLHVHASVPPCRLCSHAAQEGQCPHAQMAELVDATRYLGLRAGAPLARPRTRLTGRTHSGRLLSSCTADEWRAAHRHAAHAPEHIHGCGLEMSGSAQDRKLAAAALHSSKLHMWRQQGSPCRCESCSHPSPRVHSLVHALPAALSPMKSSLSPTTFVASTRRDQGCGRGGRRRQQGSGAAPAPAAFGRRRRRRRRR